VRSSGSIGAPGLTVASSAGLSGSGRIRTTGSNPARRSAVRIVNSAAPQLISSSLPPSSLTRSFLSVSARRLTSSRVTAKLQGWVLCTEGAQRAASTATSRACAVVWTAISLTSEQDDVSPAHHTE
jgi:hypothetical protein